MLKKIRKLIPALLTISILATAFTGCSASNDSSTYGDPIKETKVLMGTPCSITVYNDTDAKAFDAAFARIGEIESEVSINKDGTELDKVNANSGKEKTIVKDDTYDLIKKGIHYSHLSGGDFDVTIAPIVKLWNIGFDNARVPSQEEIDAKLPLVDYKDIELNDDEKSVYLKREGMEIDLGGIAKGYVADEVAKVLKDNGVKKAIIDLGGNILLVGNNKNNEDFTIGIQDPSYVTRGTSVGKIYGSDKSIVTSGLYERYLEVDGVKYHHILSPYDGYPYDNDVLGVTIISKYSIEGDGLSTAAFAKGIEEGLKYIEEQKDVEAIFISKDKKIYLTSGIHDNFVLTNDEFTIAN